MLVCQGVAIHCITGHDPAHKKREILQNSIPAEVLAQLLEEPLGRVEFDGGVVLVETEGQHFDRSDPAHLNALGNLLRVLHDISPDQFQRCPSPAFVNDLLDEMQYKPRLVWQAFCALPLQELFGSSVEQSLFLALGFDRSVETDPVCLVHGGLHDRNVLWFGDRMRLIDWSGARLDHPYVDLAQFAVSSALTPEETRLLLSAYMPALSLSDILPFIRLNLVWNLLHMPKHPTYRISQKIWRNFDPVFGEILHPLEIQYAKRVVGRSANIETSNTGEYL